jgi:hypothetical protein
MIGREADIGPRSLYQPRARNPYVMYPALIGVAESSVARHIDGHTQPTREGGINITSGLTDGLTVARSLALSSKSTSR